jgi:hypothetical protein
MNSKLTNQFLKDLRKLMALKSLYLDNTSIDDDGLKCFAEYPKLKLIDFGSQEISDVGLSYLKDARVSYLRIGSKAITDKGMLFLQDMKTLQQLTLYRSQVTDGALKQLRSVLPGLRITTQSAK